MKQRAVKLLCVPIKALYAISSGSSHIEVKLCAFVP